MRATRYLAMMNRSSRHQNRQIRLTEISQCHENIRGIAAAVLMSDISKKFFLKISGYQQRWPRPLPGAILIPPALLVAADLLMTLI